MQVNRRQVVQSLTALTATAFAGTLGYGTLVQAQSTQLRRTAQQVVVRIISQGAPGSGVLVHREGNTYFVLTAKHVVAGTNPGEALYVDTADGDRHTVNTATMQLHSEYDLAILQFESEGIYTPVIIGDSNRLSIADPLSVTGFPIIDGTQSNTIFFVQGELVGMEERAEGYGMFYTIDTLSGMSGGPVLNSSGELVGIHGRAIGRSEGQTTIVEGIKFGIPISRYQEWQGLAIAPPSPDQSPPQSPMASTDRSIQFETVTVDSRGQEIAWQTKQAAAYSQALGNGVELEMVAISAGDFEMGSPQGERDRNGDEGPQRRVTVPEFYLGQYAVTQEQWRAVAGLPQVNRSLSLEPSEFRGERLPVESVSWEEAQEFCDRLSRFTGVLYRLPSEAEWEYACRAGTTTPFGIGETLTGQLANYQASETYASEEAGGDREATVAVGSYPPNSFGLYDMHGNVWEWCEDVYRDSYAGAGVNAQAWTGGGSGRVLRGGSWSHAPANCRSASRGWVSPGFRNKDLGFRVARSATRS